MACYYYKGDKYSLEQLMEIKDEIINDNLPLFRNYENKNIDKLQQQNSEPIFVNMEPLTEKEKFIEYAMQHPTALADIYIQNGWVEQICKI
jgi:hypothetical protein